jgi:hypothetical protein
MKRIFITLALALTSMSAYCAVNISYENMDDKGYSMWVNIDGTEKKVHFDMTIAKMVIQGGNNVCTIETKCGKVEVRDGDAVYIKDGCLKVTRRF